MNDENNYGYNENLSFRQIVLNYIRKIMDLNLRVIPQTELLDFANCYKRAVLGLSDVLLPFFDDEMSRAYETFLYDYDWMMRNNTKDNGTKINNISEYVSGVMKVCRGLFRELNKLLNRNDYLKIKIYGEVKDKYVGGEEF
jgi:hypothetical protein